MIPNRWYPILRSDEVGSRPLAITRMGIGLVVFRGKDGSPHCLEDRCPHRGVKLSLGTLRDGELQCAYHGFRFNGAGRCTLLPCEGSDARIPRGLEALSFPLREAFGYVWLWWGKDPAQDGTEYPPIPMIEGLPPIKYDHGFGYDWPQSFTRSVETHFDPYHAPWVHRPVTSRLGTQVGEIACAVEGDRIELKGALVAEAPGKKTVPFRIRFVVPSIAYLELGDMLQLLSLDCPIDAHNTRRYVQHRTRFYQTTLGRILAKVLIPAFFNLGQRQDLRLVSTQQPRLYTHGTDKFVRADIGITRYHALRRTLLAQAREHASSLPPHVRLAMSQTADNEPRLGMTFERAEAAHPN